MQLNKKIFHKDSLARKRGNKISLRYEQYVHKKNALYPAKIQEVNNFNE